MLYPQSGRFKIIFYIPSTSINLEAFIGCKECNSYSRTGIVCPHFRASRGSAVADVFLRSCARIIIVLYYAAGNGDEMTVSNIIVGFCSALAFGAVVWAVINEFKPGSKDETDENISNEDGVENNHE